MSGKVAPRLAVLPVLPFGCSGPSCPLAVAAVSCAGLSGAILLDIPLRHRVASALPLCARYLCEGEKEVAPNQISCESRCTDLGPGSTNKIIIRTAISLVAAVAAAVIVMMIMVVILSIVIIAMIITRAQSGGHVCISTTLRTTSISYRDLGASCVGVIPMLHAFL
jgi:hypothetical protein